MADWLLYEHDDGRHAVAPSAEAATFARGDPAWHRVGPVQVPAPTEPAWWASALNRRATVEQWMFDAARGKRRMPTAEELRSWATKLGTPGAGEPTE